MCNSLADSPRRSCRIDATEDSSAERTERFEMLSSHVFSLADRIVAAVARELPRVLAAASSRGLALRTGMDPVRSRFAGRQSPLSYLRSVDRWRRARRHRPVAARRRSTSTELFCANLVASTSKRRGRVLSFSLSLSLLVTPFHPRAAPRRAFFL